MIPEAAAADAAGEGSAAPGVGDLVADPQGRRQVVTDVRAGRLILRPLYGSPTETPAAPDAVRVLARRGQWRDRHR